MKFAALTLVLLLAVGSQAASVPAETPTQLQHMRAAMDVYITMLKTIMKNVLANLDDAEYSWLKQNINLHLEEMHTQLKELQASVSLTTDSIVSTISDITSGWRTTIMNDIDTLKAELKPDANQLLEVVKRHTERYQREIEEIIDEFRPTHDAEMEKLKTRLQPVLDQISINAEETKRTMAPIVTKIHDKIVQRVRNLRDIVEPQVQDYKDYLRQVYIQAQSITSEDISSLKEEIHPLFVEVGEKLKLIFEKITGAVTKS